MREIQKIKQLKSQLSKVESDLEVLQIEVKNKQREFEVKRISKANLLSEIKKLECDQTPKISEHAIIRYLERVKGMDIEAISKEILTDGTLNLIDKLGGSGKYPIGSHHIVMKDFTVTTVV